MVGGDLGPGARHGEHNERLEWTTTTLGKIESGTKRVKLISQEELDLEESGTHLEETGETQGKKKRQRVRSPSPDPAPEDQRTQVQQIVPENNQPSFREIAPAPAHLASRATKKKKTRARCSLGRQT